MPLRTPVPVLPGRVRPEPAREPTVPAPAAPLGPPRRDGSDGPDRPGRADGPAGPPGSDGADGAGHPYRPGSHGEHALQEALGSGSRADRFYGDQLRDRLLPRMVEFIGRMEMAFVATADAEGECDSSLRAGPPGFLQVLDERTLAYPEYRGNGVYASLGNLVENPHVGLLMVDFVESLIGLHVNGRARIVDDEAFRLTYPEHAPDATPGRRAERWVVIDVEEAYIHCRKHIPRMERVTQRRSWGTDDPARKGGDFFGARGTPARAPRPPRRRFPSTTHLGAGASRTLRRRPSAG